MSKFSRFEAKDFLSPDNFHTDMDGDKRRVSEGLIPIASGYMADQYNKGLEIGNKSSNISISVNDTWNCNGKDGSYSTSYEKLGYHAHTAALLRGFLDSHCPIHVYRFPDDTSKGLDHSVITWDGTKPVLTQFADPVNNI